MNVDSFKRVSDIDSCVECRSLCSKWRIEKNKRRTDHELVRSEIESFKMEEVRTHPGAPVRLSGCVGGIGGGMLFHPH